MGVAALLRPSSAQALKPEAGLPGGYLNYIGGPEVTGMGRAYVGLADGIDAVPWNPAGLGFLRPNTIGILHTATPEQANLDYIGYAQPIYRMGGIGMGYARLDSGSIPQTNEFNQEVGKFRDVQQTIMVGYGYSPVPRFSFGGSIKYADQRLSGTSASGWGADLGFMSSLNRFLRAGIRIQNVMAPAFKYETASDSFPRIMTVGLASKLWSNRLGLTLDVDKALDAKQNLQYRFGAEGTFFQVAKLRFGFDFSQREFSFGLGYLWGRSSLDYSSGSNQQGFTNRFGMTHSFGGYGVALRADPLVFSPMGLTKKTTLGAQVNHSKPLHSWVVQVKNQNNDVVYSVRGSGRPPKELTWDGKTGSGMVVAPGNYGCTLAVTDMDGRTETTPAQIVRVAYGTPLDTLELGTR